MLNNEDNQFEFLDALTIVSFIIQIQNQSKLFTLKDIHDDNTWAVKTISERLDKQDEKINKILEVISGG